MPHLDPEILALLALGEDGASTDQDDHLGRCGDCRRELETLRRVLTMTRGGRSQPLASPTPAVWRGIVDILELPAEYRADPLAPREVVPLRAHRTRRRWVPLVAVAAALAVAAGFGAIVTRTATTPVATAALRPFPGWPGERGAAPLQRQGGGEQVVTLRTTLDASPDTDHEVWLMTADGTRFVSIGYLRGRSGTFAVPAGVDPARFPQVDVSDEPRDGARGHSPVSILRGARASWRRAPPRARAAAGRRGGGGSGSDLHQELPGRPAADAALHGQRRVDVAVGDRVLE